MKKIDKTVAVGMPLELYNIVRRLAEQDQRSVPSYIRLVLKDHVKQEDVLKKLNSCQFL